MGSGHKAPVLVLGTGGGKTVIFCAVTEGAAAKGKRVMILVHRKELLEQCSKGLARLGVSHGLISPNYTPDRQNPVQVASIHTLIRRLDRVVPPDLIIIDEGHHAVAGSWKKIIAAFPSAKLLLVTATPERLDGRGLGDVADDMVLGPETSWLIDEGWLSRPVYFGPPIGVDLSNVPMRGADFDPAAVAELLDKPSIHGCAVEHYRKICPYAPAIAFCASVKHAEHMAEQFRAAGFRAQSVDGAMTDTDRATAIASLGDGRLHVLTSCDIISEGTDIPTVTAAILLRPTQSLSLHLQQIGRVLRPIYAEGFDLETTEGRLSAMAAGPKPRAVILDHVGNLNRHGYAEDPRAWTLDSSKTRRARKKDDLVEVKVRQCPACYCCHGPLLTVCPNCGHRHETKVREIRTVEGTLVELPTGNDRWTQCGRCSVVHDSRLPACPKCRFNPSAIEKFENRREQAQAETLDDLIRFATRKNYKNPIGWARHVFNSRLAKRAGHQASGSTPEFNIELTRA